MNPHNPINEGDPATSQLLEDLKDRGKGLKISQSPEPSCTFDMPIYNENAAPEKVSEEINPAYLSLVVSLKVLLGGEFH